MIPRLDPRARSASTAVSRPGCTWSVGSDAVGAIPARPPQRETTTTFLPPLAALLRPLRAGNAYMNTPNFQSIADDGFLFRRCYVQQALCAPSRTVLLTVSLCL